MSYPRLTGDIDFYYEKSAQNCNLLFEAIMDFWEKDIPSIGTAVELEESGAIFQFGVPPNRIDLINQIDGVSFNESWDGKEKGALEINDEIIEIYIIGLDQLIKTKNQSNETKSWMTSHI